MAVTPGIPGASGPSNGHIIYSENENLLYVASHGSHRIYKLTLEGDLTVLAGTGVRGNNDGSASDATFSRPNGLALSITEDTLFVNSSIPLTDANGRPLNPSVIRMITGLRETSSIEQEPTLNYSIFYDASERKIKLSELPLTDELLELNLIALYGNQILSYIVQKNRGKSEFIVPPNVVNGLYFVRVITVTGKAKSKSIFIH